MIMMKAIRMKSSMVFFATLFSLGVVMEIFILQAAG